MFRVNSPTPKYRELVPNAKIGMPPLVAGLDKPEPRWQGCARQVGVSGSNSGFHAARGIPKRGVYKS